MRSNVESCFLEQESKRLWSCFIEIDFLLCCFVCCLVLFFSLSTFQRGVQARQLSVANAGEVLSHLKQRFFSVSGCVRRVNGKGVSIPATPGGSGERNGFSRKMHSFSVDLCERTHPEGFFRSVFCSKEELVFLRKNEQKNRSISPSCETFSSCGPLLL